MLTGVGISFFTAVFGLLLFVKISQRKKKLAQEAARKNKLLNSEKALKERKKIAEWYQ
jgi:hypothetical protein